MYIEPVHFNFVKFQFFCLKEKDRLLTEIGSLVPPKECPIVNLIVVGQKGSGKSSLVNTVLRNSGQLSTIAATYIIEESTLTTKVRLSLCKLLIFCEISA